MTAPIYIRRNLLFAFLLLGTLLWTGASAIDLESPQAESLFSEFTGKITESDLKTDLFKNEYAIKRHFAKFNYAYFKEMVIAPYGKGVKNPVLAIDFFHDDKPMKPKTTAYEYKDGLHHWEGEIDAKFFSQAFFVVNEYGGFGNVQVDDRIISFHPFAFNKEVIMVIEEIDPNKFPSCGVKSNTDGDPNYVPKHGHGNHDIDVLFVYPRYWNNLCGDTFWNNIFPNGILQTYTDYLTDELDIKYRQEGIVHQIRFQGHVLCSGYSPRGGDFEHDVDQMEALQHVTQERERLRADVVCMVALEGDGCGRANSPWELGPRTANGSYCAVVLNSCAVANHSLAHEMGHLLGLKHERADFDVINGNYCQFGYYMRFAFNRDQLNNNPAMIRRSIMAIGTQAEKQGIRRPSRIGLFSDGRDIRVWNVFIRMGIGCNVNANNEFEKPANNIQRINHNVPILANYR